MLRKEMMDMLPSRFYENMLDEFTNNDMNCDIYEKDGVYHIEMDLPGYRKNEIKIECHKGTITIDAKKEFNKEEHEGKKYLRRERRYGRIERSFYLGDVNDDKVDASFTDGTLHITVPCQVESNKKLISIK